MTIAQEIKRGMALAFFASAYADQADECGNPLRGEIMDQLPEEIDPAAIHAADTLAHGVYVTDEGTCAVGMTAVYRTLSAVYAVAEMLCGEGADRKLEPELFGHYCAMQAMGTGVGLESFGSEVRKAIHIPYVEFGSHSLQKDYFKSAPIKYSVRIEHDTGVFFAYLRVKDRTAWCKDRARRHAREYMAAHPGFVAKVELD